MPVHIQKINFIAQLICVIVVQRFLGHNSRIRFFEYIWLLKKIGRPLPLSYSSRKMRYEWIGFLTKPWKPHFCVTFGDFWALMASRDFYSKSGLRHFTYFMPISFYIKNKKTDEPILRSFTVNGRTDERTEPSSWDLSANLGAQKGNLIWHIMQVRRISERFLMLALISWLRLQISILSKLKQFL